MGLGLSSSRLTAMSATIEFGGTEVGELQNVAWDEVTNLVRVKAIGAPIDVAQLAGGTEYTVTASRALLNGDLMVTLMQGTLTKDALLTATGQTSIADITNLTTAQLYAALTDAGRSLSYTSGNQGLNKPIAVTFNIVIKDLDAKGVFQFDECTMQSKRHRLDVNGIIVLQDVTLWARKKIPLTDSTLISDAQPASTT